MAAGLRPNAPLRGARDGRSAPRVRGLPTAVLCGGGSTNASLVAPGAGEAQSGARAGLPSRRRRVFASQWCERGDPASAPASVAAPTAVAVATTGYDERLRRTLATTACGDRRACGGGSTNASLVAPGAGEAQSGARAGLPSRRRRVFASQWCERGDPGSGFGCSSDHRYGCDDRLRRPVTTTGYDGRLRRPVATTACDARRALRR